MKPRVEQAAAQFLQEASELPDRVLQQFTFRMKRRVKGLHQVVSDLELPVASVLSVELECISKATGTAGLTLQETCKGQREQAQQQATLQDFTQASMGLIVSTIERAQVEAMLLLSQTSEMPAQQAKIRTFVKRLFHMERTLLQKTKALPVACPQANSKDNKTVSSTSCKAAQQPLSQTEEHSDITEDERDSQDGAEVAGKGVGGSLERVKYTTLNLHALTAHTLAEMEDECQTQLKTHEALLAEVIHSHQQQSCKYESMLHTVIQTSAKMHKRALRFELLCKDKDSMIAEQEADIDSRHQAINDLQTVLAHHAHADDEQKKRIARQGETIAALQAENTKLKFEQEQTVPVSPLKPCKGGLANGRPSKRTPAEDSEWKDLQESIAAAVNSETQLTAWSTKASPVSSRLMSRFSASCKPQAGNIQT